MQTHALTFSHIHAYGAHAQAHAHNAHANEQRVRVCKQCRGTGACTYAVDVVQLAPTPHGHWHGLKLRIRPAPPNGET
jgi:hypothetical protein